MLIQVPGLCELNILYCCYRDITQYKRQKINVIVTTEGSRVPQQTFPNVENGRAGAEGWGQERSHCS